ncbi:uncharacterized protein LOC132189769 [Corylus avellana]|uniref:uncharacterized protein LOC132189769 n=1 Tax=Corylus avellana TaxID=13451 RepID=UPI00286A496A|nr:uncharacterized protein LOC132189769 [Corylus avellana]XP_059460537.1 uncharacterized protein LOC132189769 [Corylus avellana]
MSEKERKSAAVESGEKPPWPMDAVGALTFLILGGLGITRWLNMLDPLGISLIGDVIHMIGAIFLGATLTQKDTCAGLSLKSLHLTALHLAVKLSYAGLVKSELRPLDVNSLLGTVVAIYSILGTLVAIYMVGFKYKSSYVDKQHNFKLLYLLIPCALLSLLIHPMTPENSWSGITVAFCCYLNSISMLPQLQVIRKRESVDPVTAQYICWLGFSRIVYVENWIIEILLTRGQSVIFLGYAFVGYDNIWWTIMGVLSEIVNGFILADFCYYYVTIHFDDREDMQLPSGVV